MHAPGTCIIMCQPSNRQAPGSMRHLVDRTASCKNKPAMSRDTRRTAVRTRVRTLYPGILKRKGCGGEIGGIIITRA